MLFLVGGPRLPRVVHRETNAGLYRYSVTRKSFVPLSPLSLLRLQSAVPLSLGASDHFRLYRTLDRVGVSFSSYYRKVCNLMIR